MKALVLAGGKGTRLRPITFTRAKQLVPVANKPILFYGLEALRDAGITEVGIIVGDTADEVRGAVGDGGRWGLSVTYIEQQAPLGLAHAVKIAQDFIGTDPFVMYLGDNLIKDGIERFVEEFRAGGADAQILLARVPNASEFGVAELADDGHVVRLIEKPEDPPSDLALVGVYLFNDRVFEAVAAIEPSGRGELEITDAIQWLVDEGCSVRPHVIEGWWKDTGKLSDMLEANRIMLDAIDSDIAGEVRDGAEVHGRVRIGERTVVTDSVVRGPVVIGEDCEVTGAYVGPYTSIHDGCAVLQSEIEHSIMLPGARIEDCSARVSDSLMGCNSVVRRSERVQAAYHVMLGDNSQVDIV